MTIRFSRIVRSDDKTTEIMPKEIRDQLTELFNEVFKDDKSVIVEVNPNPRDDAVYRGPTEEAPKTRGRRGATEQEEATPTE